MGNLAYRKFSSSPTYVLTHSMYMHVFSSSVCVCVCVDEELTTLKGHQRCRSLSPLVCLSCAAARRLFFGGNFYGSSPCVPQHTHTHTHSRPIWKREEYTDSQLSQHTWPHNRARFLDYFTERKKKRNKIYKFIFFLSWSFHFFLDEEGIKPKRERKREKWFCLERCYFTISRLLDKAGKTILG